MHVQHACVKWGSWDHPGILHEVPVLTCHRHILDAQLCGCQTIPKQKRGITTTRRFNYTHNYIL